MHFYTYKITNLTNGKIYVGVHKTKNLDDGYMGSGKLLKRSISKHGIENFKKDILMFHESESEMFEIESLIVDQEFVDRKDTYNIKIGGFGGWGYVNAQTSKSFIVARGRKGGYATANKLKVDAEYRNHRSKNLSEKIKLAHALGKYDGSKDHLRTMWLGKNHSIETKKKIGEKNSINQKGEKNSQFGKMWIHSLEERKSTRIDKNDPIPEGWIKGRKTFKN